MSVRMVRAKRPRAASVPSGKLNMAALEEGGLLMSAFDPKRAVGLFAQPTQRTVSDRGKSAASPNEITSSVGASRGLPGAGQTGIGP